MGASGSFLRHAKLATDVKIEGLSDLDKALKKFPMKVQKNVLRGAVRAGSKEMVNRARQLTPKGTGALRRSIKTRNPRIKAGLVLGGLTAGNDDVFYARFIEFGTQSYTIKPYFPKRLAKKWKKKYGFDLSKDGYKKALSIDGGAFAKADHPGITPQPFMRTAMDTTHEDVLRAAARYLRERIPKEIAKHGH